MTDQLPTRDEKIIFALSPAEDAPDGVPLLVFLMPEMAWSYMADGLGHEFDLTAVGIPLRVVIARTATHATGMAELRAANGGQVTDARHIDVRFGKPPGAQS